MRTRAAILMCVGWVAGIIGATMLWAGAGALMSFGFPAMYFGWELAKKATETQVATRQ